MTPAENSLTSHRTERACSFYDRRTCLRTSSSARRIAASSARTCFWETERSVCELADLGFGACRLVVAGRREDRYHEGAQLPTFLRVASKFEKSAETFFAERDVPVQIIKLHGSVELAPIVGLADLIVDLVATGNTLREHDLVVVQRNRGLDGAFRRQSGSLPCEICRDNGVARTPRRAFALA